MAKKRRKTEIAWERFLAAQGISLDGTQYPITADDLKRVANFEPRLLAKFDEPDDVPGILRDNGYSLLPTANGEYLLFQGDIFHSLPACANEGSFSPKLQYPLLTAGRGMSEMDFLDYAFNGGMLTEFVGVPHLYLTIRGRERAPEFAFMVGGKQVRASGVQIEVDGGYEGDRDIVLVEAKIGTPKHFNIRQLYYPFRRFRALVPTKRIRPIFCSVDATMSKYSLFEYTFTDEADFGSLALRRCSIFVVRAIPQTSLDSLIDVAYETTADLAPQADDLNKLLRLLVYLEQDARSSTDIAEEFRFDPRQSNYYAEAGEYLGLVERSRGGNNLTQRGIAFARADLRERPLVLAKLIVNSWIFRSLIQIARQLGSFSTSDIEQLIEGVAKPDGTQRYSGDTLVRRRQTIVAWTRWLAENFRCFGLDSEANPKVFTLR